MSDQEPPEVIETIGNPVGDPVLRDPEQIQNDEIIKWSSILGGEVQVDPLPSYIDKDVIDKLEKHDLELKFVPSLDLPYHLLWSGEEGSAPPLLSRLTDENVRKQDHARFMEAVRVKYPGIPPEFTATARSEEEIGKIWELLFQAKPHWIALERTNRPTVSATGESEPFDESDIGNLIDAGTERNEDFANVQSKFREKGEAVLTTTLGVNEAKAEMRLLTPAEWLTLAIREGWQKVKPARSEWLNWTGKADYGLWGRSAFLTDVAAYAGIDKFTDRSNHFLSIGSRNINDKMGYRIAIDLPTDTPSES